MLLDLWGVLTDSRKMTPAYRERVAELLASRLERPVDAWRRALAEVEEWYASHMDAADTWSRGTWREVVERADAEGLVRTFRSAGVDPPEDPLGMARALEREVMSGIDAAFPDARPAVARLKKAGHRVYAATNATESNARGALAGARLLGDLDGIFTGERMNTGKDKAGYWRQVREILAADESDPIVVDDRLDYLVAADSSGCVALLLDRRGESRADRQPPSIRAVLRTLAGLPHYVDSLTRDRLP